MKVLTLSLLCALAAVTHASLPSAGVSLYKTIVPGQTKSFGYSTTQYINTIPASYSVGLQPQLTYQFPQYTSFVPQQTYYTIPGGSAYFSSFPVTSFYPGGASIAPVASIPTVVGTPSYPALLPAAPSGPQPGGIASGFPAQQPTPSTPSPIGDSDTAVVDSADFPNQQQESSTPEISTESKPNVPQFPFFSPFPNNPQTLQEFPAIPQVPQNSGSPPASPQAPLNPQESGQEPSFPQTPQFPQGSEQGPSFPQIPQFPQGSEQSPSFPQIPQFPQGSEGPSFPQIPQFPQGSEPAFPQFPPGFPQFPSFPPAQTPSPPSTFPGADSQNKGFDDEDTISVESA